MFGPKLPAIFCLGFALCLGPGAVAAPPLTTIQDMLYKADGTRFNGVIVIEWRGFEAADSSEIAQQSTTVRIADGAFSVQLVPTSNATGAGYYTVHYNSGGKTQFTETWSVPPSATPLRLKDVRVASAVAQAPSADTQVTISDVSGLSDELDLRPVKGGAYAPSRVALINSSGAIDGIAGNSSDCVRVDGSSGPCGTDTTPSFADAETPAGPVDGANCAFSLAANPNPASSLVLYRNGVLQKQGLDYTLAGNAITFVVAATPQLGDVLVASYRSDQTDAPGTVGTVAQVLCSVTGASTNGTSLTSLGSCTIPAGLLTAGDRVDLRFDFSHEGATTGFIAEIHWGATVLVSRGAVAAETLLSGRADAGINSNGAQASAQSWGGTTAFAASAVLATDSLSTPLKVDFLGRMAGATTETITLRNFTVLRYPSRSNP